MDFTALFKNCHAFSAAQSTSELLPDGQPAVYAFYEAFDFSGGPIVDQVDNFVTRNGRSINIDKTGWPFHIKLQFRGNPERFKGEGFKLAKELAATDVPDVHKHLHFLSFLGEPLYIGKTDNIKKRFVAHHDNGFLFKMKAEHQRPPSEFIFFAYYCEERFIRLFESILIQTINPPFCDQKS